MNGMWCETSTAFCRMNWPTICHKQSAKWAPSPVISRVISPFIGVKQTWSPIYFRPFMWAPSLHSLHQHHPSFPWSRCPSDRREDLLRLSAAGNMQRPAAAVGQDGCLEKKDEPVSNKPIENVPSLKLTAKAHEK